MRKSMSVMLTLGFLGWVVMEQATAQAAVVQSSNVTVLNVPSQAAQIGDTIDYVNARPMPLPKAPSRSEARRRRTSSKP